MRRGRLWSISVGLLGLLLCWIALPRVCAQAQPAALTLERLRSVGRAQLVTQLLARGNRGATDNVVELRATIDDLGQGHLHVRQTRGGVPVWGGEAIAHCRPDGSIASITDDFVGDVDRAGMSLQPTVNAATALQRGLAAIGQAARDFSALGATDLWILRKDDTDRLAWRVRLQRLVGARVEKPVLFIDAQDGHLLTMFDELPTGTGNTHYDGSVSLNTTLNAQTHTLKDPTRGNASTFDLNHATTGNGTLFSDADDVWGTGSVLNTQTIGADAQYGSAMTWDYFKNVHGRSGMRGDGVGLLSRVHYGNSYCNAYWDGTAVVFGDGSGNADPLVSLDMVAHEATHALIQATANLTYSGESGALSEANADIFGACVEFYANNATHLGNYMLGEQLNLYGNGMPIRYMDKPSKDGASADCWSSTVGDLDMHAGGGIGTHAFYLLAEGSGSKPINGVSYNSPTCNGAMLTGIGRAKSEKIWYRALTLYMTSSTNYAGARTATLNAARDLFGATSAEVSAVGNAWTAVNVTGVVSPAVTVLQNGVPVAGVSGALGAMLLYSVSVPTNTSRLVFTLAGGSGEADLYVRSGAAPTLTSYDCRSSQTGNAESCSVTTPAYGTWYAMVYGRAAFSAATITASYSIPSSIGTLQNGVPVALSATSTGGNNKYAITVPSGKTSLTIAIAGGTGDADLYVKLGASPALTSYDCRPYLLGNAETCRFTPPTAGTYYVMVQAYSAYANVTLTGSY